MDACACTPVCVCVSVPVSMLVCVGVFVGILSSCFGRRFRCLLVQMLSGCVWPEDPISVSWPRALDWRNTEAGREES